MKLSSKSWIKLPLIFKQMPGITRAAADVGAYIFHQCQTEPQRISVKEVAKLLSLNEKSVRRAVSALVAADLIEVQTEHGKPSVYQITNKCKELCASALVTGSGSRASSKQRMSEAERDEMQAYLSLVNQSI